MISDTYLQYGVSKEIADTLAQKGLPVSTFRNTSKINLIKNYNIDSTTVDIVKKLITRAPIDEDTFNQLLQNSNYTCCCCKGTKGKSYIIHHIEEYARTQNNDYTNLAVLCPVCHDIAHSGSGLTNRLTPDEIRRNKRKWEKYVEIQNAEAAARSGKIHDADYLNIPRITELAYSLYNLLPATSFNEILREKQILDLSGELVRPEESLRSYGFESWMLKHHFLEIFQSLLPRMQFHHLDNLLSKKIIKNTNVTGCFCFYIGAHYGNMAIVNKSEARLYFHRNGFYCEWLLNPSFITTTTAKMRFSGRSSSIIYGKIKSVGRKSIRGKNFISIDIRPYIIGTPVCEINRTPPIAHLRNPDYMFDEDEIERDQEDTSNSVNPQ